MPAFLRQDDTARTMDQDRAWASRPALGVFTDTNPDRSSLESAALACLLIVIAPGPTLVAVLNRVWTQGVVAGLYTVLGNSTCLLLWAGFASVAVGTLVGDVHAAQQALDVVSGPVLIAAGLFFVRGALRTREDKNWAAVKGEPPPAEARARSFRVGLLTSLTNPKPALLYLTVLPAALAPGHAASQITELACFQVLASTLWFSLIVVSARAVHGLLGSQADRIAAGATALVLLGLGTARVVATLN